MKEKYSPGDKVYLIHLQQEGIISRMHSQEMLYVMVEGDVIPVYISDITKEIPKSAPKQNDTVPMKEDVQPRNPSQEKIIISNKGVFLSFLPEKNNQQDITKFHIALLNDSNDAFSFQYHFHLNEKLFSSLEKILLPGQVLPLHEIELDQLNENPEAVVILKDVKDRNRIGRLNQKIRPQSFFKKLDFAPLIEKESYLMSIPVEVEKEKEKRKGKVVHFDPEELIAKMKEVPVRDGKVIGISMYEIDLHLEALHVEELKMTDEEKLKYQLKCFEQALNRAIAHGQEKLYAIHGIGSGKLKSEIHRTLLNYKDVKSFNNEYHPKYGFGATEILLK